MANENNHFKNKYILEDKLITTSAKNLKLQKIFLTLTCTVSGDTPFLYTFYIINVHASSQKDTPTFGKQDTPTFGKQDTPTFGMQDTPTFGMQDTPTFNIVEGK